MEQKNAPILISCPLHANQIIQKVDSQLETTKHLYCSDCILESDNPKFLAKSLISLDQFLSNSSIFYFTNKQKARPVSESPTDYSEILSNRAENLERLTKHLEIGKKFIEYAFDEITKMVAELIKQKKNAYFKILDDQFLSMHNHYQLFEKEVKKRYYTKSEDLESLFPSKKELESRFSKVGNASQFETFIQGIKDDINQTLLDNLNEEEKGHKKKYFDLLAQDLKEMALKKPFFDANALDLNNLTAPIKTALEQFLEKALILKESISPQYSNLNSINSKIINSRDVRQIRQWLPEKYEFKPKLLYQSSRDGFTPQAFHLKCNGQGPTITFIKCQFSGSPQANVIGGFLSESWHQNSAWIDSKDAFIFSLTKNVKYNVINTPSAGYGAPNQGPTFGGGHNIAVMGDINSCYANPHGAYEQAGIGIINVDNYAGAGQVKFTPQEIEVYSLK